MSTAPIDREYLVNLLKERKRAIVQEALRESSLLPEYNKVVAQINELQLAPRSAQGVTLVSDERKEKREVRGGHTRDMSNGPAPDARHGEKISTVYERMEEVVKGHGGEIGMQDMVDHLRELYGMDWVEEPGRSHHSRLVSYILAFNSRYPDDQRLALWPQKEEGAKRARRYEKVIYVGAERVAAV